MASKLEAMASNLQRKRRRAAGFFCSSVRVVSVARKAQPDRAADPGRGTPRLAAFWAAHPRWVRMGDGSETAATW